MRHIKRWETLTRYAEPGMGHVLIDQNSVEHGIRPTKLGAKNWMYIGYPVSVSAATDLTG